MLKQYKTKKIASVIAASLLAISSWGQNVPVDYEPGGFGADWTWTVFEDGFNPPLEIIANPDPSGINCSETVAKFTALAAGNPWAGCETMHGADIGTFTIDATNSIIRIMVWKPVISDVGIKLVDAGGASLGEIKIANTVINQWEQLEFDFSSHIGMTYDQLVIFPDFNLAGRAADNICYFDNVYGEEGSPCSAPYIPIDHEAGGFGADWTWTVFEDGFNPPLEMVENPDTTGINCSPTVAQFTALAAGNPWAGYESSHGAGIGEWTIDEDNKIINVMVYKPVISDVGVKLVAADGFALPEIKIPNTLINEWEVISFDFSAHIGNTYDQIVIFPDFDLAGRVGDNICYIDNIYGDSSIVCEPVLAEGPNAPIDHEIGGFGADWTWTVFENDFNPPLEMVENPDTTGINCSSTVAQFTAIAAGNPWAGYESSHGAGIGEWTIDEDNKIINVMVYKPVISDVGVKLVAADGFALPEIKIPNTLINEWEVISFDFSAHIGNTYDQIVIFPDFDLAGRVGDNICYIDNIYGDSSYACPPLPLAGPIVPIDHELDGNGADWTWTVFENDFNPPLEMAENPDTTGINCSSTVAKFTALEAGNPWAGYESLHGAGIGEWTIDADNSIINVMVYKPVISDVGVKLVAADGFALPEIKIPNTVINEWELISFDFSAHIGNTYDQIVIFPDFDLDGRAGDNICYIDNIYGDSSYACDPVPLAGPNIPIDHEVDGNGADWTWTVFEDDINPPVEMVENPDTTGINCSSTVAKFTALAAGNPWAGYESAHGEDLGAFMIDESNKLINVMVYKPVLSDVGIKLIQADGTSLGELKIPNTLVNTWELLTFDFSSHLGITIDQIAIFPDYNLDGRSSDNICYIDNIWGDSLYPCDIDTTIIDDSGVEEFDGASVILFPNPSSDLINLRFTTEFVGTIVITDLLGKEILQVTSSSTYVQIDLRDLPSSGIYFAKIVSNDGRVINVQKFMYH